MAIAWLEPFDLYPGLSTAGVGLSSYWNLSASSHWSLVAGLLGNGQAVLQTSLGIEQSYMIRAINESNQVSLGMFFAIDDLPELQIEWFRFRNSGNSVSHLSAWLNPTGTVTIKDANGAEQGTGSFLIGAGVVNHVSLRIDQTTGAVEFYFNGNDVADISLTGKDFTNGTSKIGIISLCSNEGVTVSGRTPFVGRFDHMVCLYDEYVVLPELELYYASPDADVVTDFTPLNGGTNVAEIDEVLIDSDTSYNESDTAGHQDIFQSTELPFIPEYIWCISQATTAKKSESATREMQNLLRIDGIDYNSDSYFLSTTYVIYFTHWLLNPATGLDWDPTSVRDKIADHTLLPGYELITGA